MDQIPTLQQLEYWEASFEVSKTLTQAGFLMDKPAFVIPWGLVAEAMAQTLADYGLSPERLDEATLLNLAQGAKEALENDAVLIWRDIIRRYVPSHPIIMALLAPADIADDEGPMTEQYENATRLGDDEAYWVDGGASADLFDDL